MKELIAILLVIPGLALAAGGGSMERIAQVPASTGLVVQGTIIAILVASRSAADQCAQV